MHGNKGFGKNRIAHFCSKSSCLFFVLMISILPQIIFIVKRINENCLWIRYLPMNRRIDRIIFFGIGGEKPKIKFVKDYRFEILFHNFCGKFPKRLI